MEGGEFTVEVIDSVADYVELMKEIFDFEELKKNKLPILIDCLNGGQFFYILFTLSSLA